MKPASMRLRSLRQLSRAVLHATSRAIVENFLGQSGNAREVLRPGLRRQLCGFSSTLGDAIFHRNPPPRHKPAPKAHPYRHRARGSNSTSVPGHTSRRGSTPISTQAFQRWDLLIGEAPWCLDRFRRGNDQHSLPCEGDPLLAETENKRTMSQNSPKSSISLPMPPMVALKPPKPGCVSS